MMTRYDEVMAEAKAALRGMIRRKDPAGISAFRSVIAALENACAVPVDSGSASLAANEHVAGAEAFGGVEAARRMLTTEEVDSLLAQEKTMREEQAATLELAARDLEAAMARYQAALIGRLAQGALTPR